VSKLLRRTLARAVRVLEVLLGWLQAPGPLWDVALPAWLVEAARSID
jgi:hypothetical protein